MKQYNNSTIQQLPRARYARRGQSLIEILIAVAVGVILIVAGITLLAPAIRNNANVTRAQTAAALGKELLENVRVLSESDWASIGILGTTEASKYHIVPGSPFATASGIESVTVATTTYQRYFYLDDVHRNASGKIASSGTSDPAARKITVVYIWPGSSSAIVSFLRRTGGSAFSQTDWSGGPGQDGPFSATGTNARFAAVASINYASSGSIRIEGIPGP